MMNLSTPSNLFILNNMAERVGFDNRELCYLSSSEEINRKLF
jgi:hypothetical protein